MNDRSHMPAWKLIVNMKNRYMLHAIWNRRPFSTMRNFLRAERKFSLSFLISSTRETHKTKKNFAPRAKFRLMKTGLTPISIQCKLSRDQLFAITFFWNAFSETSSVAFDCLYFNFQTKLKWSQNVDDATFCTEWKSAFMVR
jgi:hypothetical protein